MSVHFTKGTLCMMYKLRQVSTEILRQYTQTFLKICLQKHFNLRHMFGFHKRQSLCARVLWIWPNITSEKSHINI